MARYNILIPDKCLNCPQFRKDTCVVFSVNIKKYGIPKECKI